MLFPIIGGLWDVFSCNVNSINSNSRLRFSVARRQDCAQTLVIARLFHEIEGPDFHGADRQIHISMPGNENDRNGFVDCLNLFEELDTRHARQTDIGQDYGGAMLPQQLKPIFGIVSDQELEAGHLH